MKFIAGGKMAGWTSHATLCAVSWLSVLRPALSQGAANVTHSAGKTLTEPERVAAITVPCVLGGLLLIAIIVFICYKVREKRQTEGTYRPSSEEQSSGKELGEHGKDNLAATWEDERTRQVQGSAV
ncbi:protein crumbs homolog 3 [Ambystoma mexicanum]|uniref:protein crumbs homolog 3 n=1 Tax=Ambystoma mexicanum TaxID=8296 RepID=UPI0037E84ACB